MGSMFKRILLFLALNAVVLITISFVLNILNIRPYLDRSGINYQALLSFCLVWGMVGAFISLALSRIMAKWFMGVEVIDPQSVLRGSQEAQLFEMVKNLSQRAGLPCVPEVGVYASPEVNAFATGPTKRRSLVAVSSGLLNRMNSAEVEAVLAHEVSHITNGDMVTMTLLQGVVNAFVMFFARALAFAVTRLGKKEGEESSASPFMYSILVVVFEILFMILGAIIVAAFSRYREFRADAGGARLAGREKMIGALQALERAASIHDTRAEQPAFQSMKISNNKSMMFRLFASHPPLEERIERLKKG
jgi:heat shock protein HtpX